MLAFRDAIVADYILGVPRALVDLRAEPREDPDRLSAFHIIDWPVFKRMPTVVVQQILAKRAILLTNCPTEGYDINDALDLLGPPERLIEVQGIVPSNFLDHYLLMLVLRH